MSHRRTRWAVMALALGAGAQVAQGATMTVEDLMRRHAEARGGAARWQAISSMEIKGSQTSFSDPFPFTILRARPDKLRFEQTQLKQPVVLVHDGTKSWWINGLNGNTWPLPAPEADAAVIRREAQFDPPLLGAARQGNTVVLEGLEEFEGQKAWKVKLTRKDGVEETWYLSPKTYLEVASITPTVDFGQTMDKFSYYSDFRSESGLVMPHVIETEYGQRNETLRIEQVRTGVAVDDAQFRMPPPPGMDLLLPMVGSWEVKVETRPNARAPWEARQTTSTIEAALANGLLQERYSVRQSDGTQVDTLRSWSYDLFRKVYRVVEADNYSFMQNVMEGAPAEGKLIVDNLKSGTTLDVGGQSFNLRLIAYEITPQGFKLDAEVSRDGGRTWRTDTKYTYTRK